MVSIFLNIGSCPKNIMRKINIKRNIYCCIIVAIVFIDVTALIFFEKSLQLYTDQTSQLSQAQAFIEAKYQKEFDALRKVALFPKHPSGEASFQQIDDLRLELASPDIFSVDSLYDHYHGGRIIKSSPSNEGFSKCSDLLYSKNARGDTLYYAKSSSGVNLYWYELNVPNSKSMRLFIILLNRDQIVGRKKGTVKR